jgi:glycyl-tRNA synthetase beta chain
VEALDNILFMEQLGSMRAKTTRVATISEALSGVLGLSDDLTNTAVRAAGLCKADLVTHMVYEFPELQGTMGGHYARLSGEETGVAAAVSEHYAPRHAGDAPAITLPGAVVAIADKLDTLVCCFGLGFIPSGSQDPYALRRSALGIVSTLKHHSFAIPLSSLVRLGLSGLAGKMSRPEEDVLSDVHDFLLQRVRFLFAEQGLRYDVVDAVLGSSADDLPGLWERARVLQGKLNTPQLTALLTPFTRAANLVRDTTPLLPQPALFGSDAERKLYEDIGNAVEIVEIAAARGDYEAVFAALASLSGPIDNFFTEVMVMVDDQQVRNNRLALLQQVKDSFLVMGDLSKIVQEKK